MRHYFPYLSPPYKRWGRRPRLLFLLFLVVVFFYVWYDLEMKEFAEGVPPGQGGEQLVEKKPDRIGEEILYDVMLAKIRIGQAKYRHLSKTLLNEKPVHLITFETKALRFRDRETIYADPETFLPIVIDRKVSQILKPEKIKEEYDQENFVLKITKKRFTTEERIIKKDSPIHNSILLPYFVRNKKDLEVGWSFMANLPQHKHKITLKAIESVTVPAGDFRAFYFESEPVKGKQIKIWISTDEGRIPLRLEGTGGIGYKLLMRKYTLPKATVRGDQ